MKGSAIASIAAVAAAGTCALVGVIDGSGDGKSGVSVSASPVQFEEEHTYTLPSNGIRITSCHFDKYGVDVAFETALPPPYVVGVFTADEIGLERVYPIRYKMTRDKGASLAGDFFTKKNTFVQVFTEAVTNNPNFRELSSTERDLYFDSLHEKLDRANPRRGNYKETWDESVYSYSMRLVDDCKWMTFIKSDNPYARITGSGWKTIKPPRIETPSQDPRGICRIRDLDDGTEREVFRAVAYRHSRTNDFIMYAGLPMTNVYDGSTLSAPAGQYVGSTNTYARFFITKSGAGVFTKCPCVITWLPHNVLPWPSDYGRTNIVISSPRFGPYDTSVGCGYRVTFYDTNETFQVERAISMFPDRSQEVVLSRGFKSLSANGGLKVVLDWRGELAFAVETNAVPNRIYWEGL